ELRPLVLDPLGAFLIKKAHDAVRVRYIELVADERHAEWLPQPLEHHEPLVGNAVAAGVTKQYYAVGALGDRTGLPHHPGLRKGAWPPCSFRLACGLGGEHVAVGQEVEPTRMLETTGGCAELEAA